MEDGSSRVQSACTQLEGLFSRFQCLPPRLGADQCEPADGLSRSGQLSNTFEDTGIRCWRCRSQVGWRLVPVSSPLWRARERDVDGRSLRSRGEGGSVSSWSRSVRIGGTGVERCRWSARPCGLGVQNGSAGCRQRGQLRTDFASMNARMTRLGQKVCRRVSVSVVAPQQVRRTLRRGCRER